MERRIHTRAAPAYVPNPGPVPAIFGPSAPITVNNLPPSSDTLPTLPVPYQGPSPPQNLDAQGDNIMDMHELADMVHGYGLSRLSIQDVTMNVHPEHEEDESGDKRDGEPSNQS